MAKEITMEQLAGMVKRGFDETARKSDVDKQFTEVKTEIKEIKNQFPPIYKELAAIGRDVAEIKRDYVYREEFEDIMARLSLVERKLGIRSGK